MTAAPESSRRRFITVRETCDLLGGIHLQTAYLWIAQGRIPSARIGRRVLVDRRLLEEGLEAQIQISDRQSDSHPRRGRAAGGNGGVKGRGGKGGGR